MKSCVCHWRRHRLHRHHTAEIQRYRENWVNDAQVCVTISTNGVSVWHGPSATWPNLTDLILIGLDGSSLCWHELYISPYRSTDLRLRGHPFRLPEYCTDLHKKSFIVRTLYKYIKWYSIGIILLMLYFYRLSYLVCFIYYHQLYGWCAFVAS